MMLNGPARRLTRVVALLCVSMIATEVMAGPNNFPILDVISPQPGPNLHPQDKPEIEGPGAVSTAGNVWLKSTNIGVVGNPFTALSNDPSCQWPGPSGVEYLFFVGLWIGAKDLASTDPARIRRVSQDVEWRPPSLEPEDRIYESYEGKPASLRLKDDDGDGLIDEDRLDGRDNDLDGAIDEDYASISQQMFSSIMRDDTQEAEAIVSLERHIPLGLEVQQKTYAFSIEGETDYSVVEYVVTNITDHTLDSVYVAFEVDQDVGPASQGAYYSDDLPEPQIPQGPDSTISFPPAPDPDNPNTPYMDYVSEIDPRRACGCSRDAVRVHGFSMIDDDSDGGTTRGASSFLLLDHTIDPLGIMAPARVQFRMYTYYTAGLPFSQGGPPTNDSERFQLISSTRNVDQEQGYILAKRPAIAADYVSLCSVGPYLDFAPGDTIRVAYAIAVQEIDYRFPLDDFAKRYAKVIRNAVAAQKNYRGEYEVRPEFLHSELCGKEGGLIAEPGEHYYYGDCRDLNPACLFCEPRLVTDSTYTWFDFDCNSCTGVRGHRLRRWLAGTPPPNPNMTTQPGDNQVSIRWDNLSEYTPDPQSAAFDFKGYAVWRSSGWDRAGSSIGPANETWENIVNYHFYDDTTPLIEQWVDESTGDTVRVETVDVLLNRNWTASSPYPRLIFPGNVPCVELTPGVCDTVFAKKSFFKDNGQEITLDDYPVVKYPIGRYELKDPQAKNGFVYFYAISAFDSTGKGAFRESLKGGRAAREDEAVIPQVSNSQTTSEGIYVVPNPYRGSASWDLAPNPTDPTGTHVDFFNLPANWSLIRIFTVSGDLVRELRPDDIQPNGTRQREFSGDAQAAWNLITRNGQEVVSGIYLFAVRSDRGTKRGKFVIIR